MLRWALILSMAMMSYYGQAQLSVYGSYLITQMDDLNNTGDGDDITWQWRYGLGYRIAPFRETRIEFNPTFTYGYSDPRALNTFIDGETFFQEIKYQAVEFLLPMHFYFLDFKSDCDCPSWDKEKNALQKGLFFFISPELSYRMGTTSSIENNFTREETDLLYGGQVGLGFDYQPVPRWTITGSLGLGYTSRHTWDEPVLPEGTALASSTTSYLAPALRLRYNFNERKSYRRY